MPKGKLTVKQDKFARRYAAHGNGTQAAIEAGYSQHSARAIACENLTKPDIAEEVERHRRRTAERLDISREKLVNDAAHDAEQASINGDWNGANAARTFVAKAMGYLVERSLNVTVDMTDAHLQALRDLAQRGRGQGYNRLNHEVGEPLNLAARAFTADGMSMAGGSDAGQDQAVTPHNMHYDKGTYGR